MFVAVFCLIASLRQEVQCIIYQLLGSQTIWMFTIMLVAVCLVHNMTVLGGQCTALLLLILACSSLFSHDMLQNPFLLRQA